MNLRNFSALNFIPFLVTLTLWFSNCYCADSICTNVPKSPCICHLKNGTVIDLTSVARHDKKPWFQDVPFSSGLYRYSYNPCFGFLEGKCSNPDTAVCQSKPNTDEYYTTGVQSSATFLYDGNHIIIKYESRETEVRQTNVTLVCSPNTNLTVVKEDEPEKRSYTMVLYSPCACPDGCITKPPPDDGLSTGSVLVILLFTFIFCYLVGGIIYQKIVRGAQGYELIPNYEFWFDFPLLIRDGCIFCYNGCNSAPPRGTYDSI